jgi:hypothetical protein
MKSCIHSLGRCIVWMMSIPAICIGDTTPIIVIMNTTIFSHAPFSPVHFTRAQFRCHMTCTSLVHARFLFKLAILISSCRTVLAKRST